MFNWQHPDEFLKGYEQERLRAERRSQLLRSLRGSVPPFDGQVERKLQSVLRASLPGTSSGR